MKIGIAIHESHAEAIGYFCRIANLAQDSFLLEPVELTSDEEDILAPRDIAERDEETIEHSLFKLKLSRGFAETDLFIALFDGRLLGGAGGEPYFLWASGLEDDDPGVALISLSYLKGRDVLDIAQDYGFVARSIHGNMMCAIALMATALESHYETSGCILDFCSNLQDINYSLQRGFVFCEQRGCREELEKTEVGRGLLAVAAALNAHPFKLRSNMQMMPRCFKTDISECPRVSRIVPGQVFIGMPFRGHFEDVFEYGIKPALEEMGYSHWKADDHPHIIDLMCKVCEGIQKSEFAIVDLSEWNPNVFFELGLCYGLGRRLLIIKREDSEIPTDLKGMEYVPYANAKELGQRLREVVPRVFV